MPPHRPEEDQRGRDRHFALPTFGALLLMPPFLNLFNREVTVFGLPLVAVYIFALWLALVIGVFLLGRRSSRKDDGST